MSREKIKHPLFLSQEEVQHHHLKIDFLAGKGIPEETFRSEYREYAPDTPLGRAVCESYPLEKLTAVLKERAQELGRAPTQQDIFPIYRIYLKRRFGTWPAALRAAGLRPGLEMRPVTEDWPTLLLETPEIGHALLALAERWMTRGIPPLRRETPEAGALRAQFGSWDDVLSAAKDLDTWLETHPTPVAPKTPEQLEELNRLADRLGRTPLREEAPEELRLSLRIGWGSWGCALAAAGLPPLTEKEQKRAIWEHQQRKAAGSCRLFLVREPTPKQKELLDALKIICHRLNRSPLREELSQELRTALAKEFGSLRNALFQFGRAPLSGQEAQKLRIKRRKQTKL